MERVIPYIKLWFQSKSQYFPVFLNQRTQVENWFLGELLYLLNLLRFQNIIYDFTRQFQVDRLKVDLQIVVAEQSYLCELKSGCLMRDTIAQLAPWIGEDLDKLDGIHNNPGYRTMAKYCLIFQVYQPHDIDVPEVWQQVINSHRQSHPTWSCITRLEEFPEGYFIQIWTRD